MHFHVTALVFLLAGQYALAAPSLMCGANSMCGRPSSSGSGLESRSDSVAASAAIPHSNRLLPSRMHLSYPQAEKSSSDAIKSSSSLQIRDSNSGANTNTFLGHAKSTDPRVPHANIQASGQSFWVNKASSSHCYIKSKDKPCDWYNTAFVYIKPDTVSLYVAVPGGQQVYVAPDGKLSFTTSHSTMQNGTNEGFDYTPSTYTPSTSDVDGQLKFNGTSFMACPNYKASWQSWEHEYQVYAAGADGFKRTDCVPMIFGTATVNKTADTNPPAWDYI